MYPCTSPLFLFFYFFKFYFIFKLYIIVLVLPNIKMNPPQVLPKSKHLLISWLQSPSSVILEPRKMFFLLEPNNVFIVSLSICHEVMGPDAMIFVFWMLGLKPTFSLSSFIFINRLFSSSLFAIREVSSAYLRFLIFGKTNTIM